MNEHSFNSRLARETLLADMKQVDLERLVVCTALSGFAFLSFAGLVSAPAKCPNCGWRTWWNLREDQRSEQPHFFCGRVLDQGQRVPTTGRKKGWKTVNRKVCLCNRSWRAWSPEFLKMSFRTSTHVNFCVSFGTGL